MSKETNLLCVTDYHPLLHRIVDNIGRFLFKIGIGKDMLTEATIKKYAFKETGLNVFGDESFLDNMRIFLNSVEQADLTPSARLRLFLTCSLILSNRLWAHDLFNRYPEIMERNIANPIVVMGCWRSGTTRLQRMLATDPRLGHLKLWELYYPVPWPKSFNAKIDPRIKNVNFLMKGLEWYYKEGMKVHPMATMDPDEEAELLNGFFCNLNFIFQFKITEYAKLCMHNDQTKAYEYMVKLIKLILWFRNDNSNQSLVLKAPHHMFHLESLMRVFPNAKLLFIHRDPVKIVGSTCSMAWNQMLPSNNTIDPFWIGESFLDIVDLSIQKAFKVRDSIMKPEQYIDILYEDMNTDWKSTMQRVYSFIGMDFTGGVEKSMEHWLATEKKYTGHRYKLEDFGLDKKEVDERLMYYRKRFDIPYEGGNH